MRRTDGKQWEEQHLDKVPFYHKDSGSYQGFFADNCCTRPPNKSDLHFLQPGFDGSEMDHLCATNVFTDKEFTGRKGEVLHKVARWVTMEVAQKVQHSTPIAAWKNRVASTIDSPLSPLPDDIKAALLEHAGTWEKAIKFLQRMGGKVSGDSLVILSLITNYVCSLCHCSRPCTFITCAQQRNAVWYIEANMLRHWNAPFAMHHGLKAKGQKNDLQSCFTTCP